MIDAFNNNTSYIYILCTRCTGTGTILYLQSLAVLSIAVLPLIMICTSSFFSWKSCYYCSTFCSDYNIKAISISLPVAVWKAQKRSIIVCWWTEAV